MSLPFGLRLYRAGTHLAGWIVPPLLKDRVRKGKEDPERLCERQGLSALARPEGRLIWIHGASVGESLISLCLIHELKARHPNAFILCTSGTRTSAHLLSQRLPEGSAHHYVPIDRLDWAKAFVDHWQPDLAIFVESELWPNLIIETARTGAAMALVNARMNEGSLKSWRAWHDSANWLLGCFDWIGPADQRTAEGLSKLLGQDIAVAGNLKLDAPAAPAPANLVEDMRTLVGDRPLWLAASTHEGEEALVLNAHKQLLSTDPNALLILAPRHPERAQPISDLITKAGLSYAQRSKKQDPDAQTQVWLVDTLGEMGFWFALAPAALMGGSLVDGIGGHNPVEATKAGAKVATGPFTASFTDIYAAYIKTKGAVITKDSEAIAAFVRQVWAGDGPSLDHARQALKIASGGALETTLNALDRLIPEEA
ncbi:3-deoxy-D-manno-octulosonic acid transferase [Woodsholea maritima]|uniref:3-deoxy-D-manno-octulosonic acid transferase n=1 Tax=Woodsholea maritima TaxID=240237 RepID=UPI0003811187|nr:3-deoxy-D-manno-octulosonic acid transferase [Woodsholea maritima]